MDHLGFRQGCFVFDVGGANVTGTPGVHVDAEEDSAGNFLARWWWSWRRE